MMKQTKSYLFKAGKLIANILHITSVRIEKLSVEALMCLRGLSDVRVYTLDIHYARVSRATSEFDIRGIEWDVSNSVSAPRITPR